MGRDSERAALIYQHKSASADRRIADGLDELLRGNQGDHDGTADTPAPDG